MTFLVIHESDKTVIFPCQNEGRSTWARNRHEKVEGEEIKWNYVHSYGSVELIHPTLDL